MDMSGAAVGAEKQTTREVLKQIVKSTGQRSLYVYHLPKSPLMQRVPWKAAAQPYLASGAFCTVTAW